MGGTVRNPSYQEVCEKKTGHAETVEVVYDLRQLSRKRLLSEFFLLHDFTQDRRPGGGQYRSAIFYDPLPIRAEKQMKAADEIISLLTGNGFIPTTERSASQGFYPADSRHQQFCSARGMQPKKRDFEQIRKILTF